MRKYCLIALALNVFLTFASAQTVQGPTIVNGDLTVTGNFISYSPIPILYGGTNANSAAGAWESIFPGASIAASCGLLITDVNGVLRCGNYKPLNPANNLSDVANIARALSNLGAVTASTTVNGHALSGNVTVSASDLTSGTLPHAQLPALVSADIPNNAANTRGTAASAVNTSGGTVSAKNMASIGPRYDVTQYGATGLVQTACTGSMSAGSYSLTVGSSCTWAVGNGIYISNAGAGGATPLITSVTAVNGSVLTLASAAVATITNQPLYNDDTVAIQAAVNACLGSEVSALGNQSTYLVSPPSFTDTNVTNGGIVEFPGNRQYMISSTINMHYGCQLEGIIGSVVGNFNEDQLSTIMPNIAPVGSTASITGYTITSTPNVQIYNQDFMLEAIHTVAFSGTNSYTAGAWIQLSGFTTANGLLMNNLIVQVAPTGLSSSGFSVIMPWQVTQGLTNGTVADAGTATPATVAFAFDQNAAYQVRVSKIQINPSYANLNQFASVAFYLPARGVWYTQFDDVSNNGASNYGIYALGGSDNLIINRFQDFTSGVAAVYVRLAGTNDNIELHNADTGGYGTSVYSGIMLLVDNTACLTSQNYIHIYDSKFWNSGYTIPANEGAITFWQCAAATQYYQGSITVSHFSEQDFPSTAAGINGSSVAVYPPSDEAIGLLIQNSNMPQGTGANTTKPIIGIPALSRDFNFGTAGIITELTYAPSFLSSSAAESGSYYSPMSLLGDVAFGQLWQHKVQASALLYSDTAYAALPNATTLYAGQVLAPPSYWNGANGKRYALNVVYQTGTTGSPNGGSTTCSGNSGQATLICTSSTDLSVGQIITIGSDTGKKINSINAINPGAVLVYLSTNLGAAYTNTSLGFTAPVLGLEMQLPTKSAAAPSTLTWSQGDAEQNSGAAANGIAGWVNVAAGTPGTWAGIPLGNSSGLLTPSQITPNAQVMYGCGTTTTCANASIATPRQIWGTVALASGTATVIGISPAFTSTSTFSCTSNDTTAVNYSKCVPASTSSITCTGSSTDTISYACYGN
ncbi:MAG: hypothetical protein WAN35_14010 [Terracidiphilus sp.]